MRTVLTANVPVTRVAVFAEMAWLERRPELAALCAAASGAGGRLSPAVVQQTLPGLGDVGARNIVDWCRALGLCDPHGSLTALGEDVGEHGEAPIPEQGVYDLWVARHPLLGSRILHAERLSSTRDPRFDDVTPLDVEPDRDVPFRSVVEPAARFILRDLPSNGGTVGGIRMRTEARARVRWTLDFDAGADRWELDGVLDGGRHGGRPVQHKGEATEIDPWSVIEGWALGPLAAAGRWQASTRRLGVRFEGLTEGEQEQFVRDVELARVEIPGRGTWDGVRLEKAPIGPLTEEDGTRWALARLDRRLRERRRYLARDEVRRLFADACEGTPLEPHRPVLPSHDDLLARFAAVPEVFWSLAASVDLAPTPPSAEELGILRVGAPSPVTEESNGVIRVPYRGGWSMKQLLDRLLAGTTPRRLLLADRYVRGESNLAALRLLVATARASVPTVVEVWTGDEADGAELERVRAITGTPPKRYRDMFGKAPPHDRYLVVDCARGQPVGWQMSNSPLDARPDTPEPAPTTPLRWRDFVATKLGREDLPDPLGQWLAGGGR